MIYILITWLSAPFWWPVSYMRRWQRVKKILVLEIAGMGDVVCSTPVFHALRQTYPQATIDLLTDQAWVELFQAGIPELNQVIGWRPQRLKGLLGRLQLARRLSAYDTALCLNPGAAQLSAMCWAALPRRMSVLPDVRSSSYRLLAPLLSRVEWHTRGASFLHTQLRLVQGHDLPSPPSPRRMQASPASRAQAAAFLPDTTLTTLGLAIGSGRKIKTLPFELLRDVVQTLLLDERLQVVLLGVASDREQAQRLLAHCPSRRLIDATGRFALADIPGLLLRLQVFLGVDSGLTYLAHALGARVVCVVGPVDMSETGLQGERVRLIDHKPPCAPCSWVFATTQNCHQAQQSCLQDLDAASIVAAVHDLLHEDEPLAQP